jgi:uncharacterized protein with PIN domain
MTKNTPKFLVDEMLQRLGRWLRAAGYDTRIATDSESDYYLLRQAIDEDRLLITKDTQLAQHRSAKGRVIIISGDTLDNNVAELSEYLDIDWTYKPFTRCMVCNSLLTQASTDQREQMPEMAKMNAGAVYYCPQCNQVYWEGSHVKRMRHHLTHWHDKYDS